MILCRHLLHALHSRNPHIVTFEVCIVVAIVQVTTFAGDPICRALDQVLIAIGNISHPRSVIDRDAVPASSARRTIRRVTVRVCIHSAVDICRTVSGVSGCSIHGATSGAVCVRLARCCVRPRVIVDLLRGFTRRHDQVLFLVVGCSRITQSDAKTKNNQGGGWAQANLRIAGSMTGTFYYPIIELVPIDLRCQSRKLVCSETKTIRHSVIGVSESLFLSCFPNAHSEM